MVCDKEGMVYVIGVAYDVYSTHFSVFSLMTNCHVTDFSGFSFVSSPSPIEAPFSHLARVPTDDDGIALDEDGRREDLSECPSFTPLTTPPSIVD
mmetsp:Transcript_3048/g.4672  ORF Transcript_3048/g.4672 Transcript_3048/m.4672 type:complete len:95 (-) Transcript_3048:571-855(-)